MTEIFRAFIAVDLPESVKSFLGETQEALKAYGFRVKWVRPQNIHLTLKFLGDTAAADVDRIADAMALAAGTCPIVSLAVKGIGVFPDVRRARVIWAGLKGQLEILADFQQALDAHLADLGFPRETRPFKSHLTVGRVKGKIAPDRMRAAIDKLKEVESESFEINKVILFKSDLRPSGAVYTKVQAIDFQGSSQKG
ncbi:MAG: RNA 2',3'-cyclic phosphodiesterase [Desulfobacterales bacterium]|jgi:2'-5' RNA ligase